MYKTVERPQTTEKCLSCEDCTEDDGGLRCDLDVCNWSPNVYSKRDETTKYKYNKDGSVSYDRVDVCKEK